jgi:opacity protein-like surface antigen
MDLVTSVFSGVQMRKITIPTLLLTLCGGSAIAADNGFYLGASLGQSNVQLEEQSLKFDGTDTAYKIIAGFRPLDWLGVEMNYVDFGNPDDSIGNATIKSDGNGVSAFAIGFLAVGPVDLFVKGGLINWDATIKSPSLPALSVDDSGTDFAYGAGVQFRFLSLSVRGEYEVFDIGSLDDANLLSVGVTWTFL